MRNFLLYLLLFISNSMFAQNTFRPSVYLHNMNFYNTASGWNDTMRGEASLYFQHKWVDNDLFQKPVNVFANYLGNAKNTQHHYSAGYIFDGYSFYTRNQLFSGYSYSLDFSGKSFLTFGSRAIFSIDNINAGKIGQSLENNISGVHFTPDLDLGIDYRWKGLNMGVATKNIFANSVKVDGAAIIKNNRIFNAHLWYQFMIAQKVGVAPIVMLYHDRILGFDAGLNLSYKKLVDVAYILRVKQLRSIATAGVNISHKFYIGLAIDGSLLLSDINTDLNLRFRF